MKKYVVGLLSCLFVLTGCSGEIPPLEPDHYLYEITNEEGGKVYLLGSVAAGPSRLTFDGQLQKAYEESECVVLELSYELDEEDYAANNEALTSYPLSQFVGDEEFDVIWKAIKKEYPAINDGYLEYNVIYTRSQMEANLQNLVSVEVMYGIDHSLSVLAINDDKPIYEIKDYPTYCKEVSKIGFHSPKFLLALLLDKKAASDAYEQVITNYSLGTLNEQIIFKNRNEFENVPEEYQTETIREEYEQYTSVADGPTNKDIVNAITQYMQTKTALVAVNVHRFFGENNVLELLEGAGYTVTKCAE